MKTKIKTLIIVGFLFNTFILTAKVNQGSVSENHLLLIILLLLLLFFVLFYLVPVIDILKSRFVSDIDKLIWLAAVIFVPFLGLLLYLLIGRKQKVNYKK